MTIGAFFILVYNHLLTKMIEIRHATITDSANSQFAYDGLYSEGGIDLS